MPAWPGTLMEVSLKFGCYTSLMPWYKIPSCLQKCWQQPVMAFSYPRWGANWTKVKMANTLMWWQTQRLRHCLLHYQWYHFYSTDYGTTWNVSSVNVAIPSTNKNCTLWHQRQNQQRVCFVAVIQGRFFVGIYKSVNNGLNFTLKLQTVPTSWEGTGMASLPMIRAATISASRWIMRILWS